MVRQQDNDSIQGYGVLNSRDLLGTWRRVESTFVLLSHSLDEGTVVAANAYSESHSMVPVRLEAFETCLDLLDLRPPLAPARSVDRAKNLLTPVHSKSVAEHRDVGPAHPRGPCELR